MNPGFDRRSHIFREYDIRGIAGREINGHFAYQLGKVFAHYAYAKTGASSLTVSVGRDCRLTSDEYAEALIKGLLEGGVSVFNLDVCPTPLTYFSEHHYQTDGAIMITGSHNPAEYNGFKIALRKSTLHGEQIQELRELFANDLKTKLPPGKVSNKEITQPYLDFLSRHIKPNRKLKVVIDAGNGTAGPVAPELFALLGADVTTLYCDLDGTFPNHHPDPTVEHNLTALKAKVKEVRADFGVGFDGDSDRIGVVDELGNTIYGDELMILFARDVLKHHPGATVIGEVKSSQRLYQDVKSRGGKAVMWKAGHSLIKSKMQETGALLAGEMSGHIFFADRWFGFDDAIYAASRLYEIVAEQGELSSLLKDLPETFCTPELRLECEEALKFALVTEAAEILHGSQGTVCTLDGLRVDFEDRWGLIRASNTQAVIVMRFEAKNKIALEEIQGQFEAALNAAARKLDHVEFKSSL